MDISKFDVIEIALARKTYEDRGKVLCNRTISYRSDGQIRICDIPYFTSYTELKKMDIIKCDVQLIEKTGYPSQWSQWNHFEVGFFLNQNFVVKRTILSASNSLYPTIEIFTASNSTEEQVPRVKYLDN